ncbi:hypothetical protein [Biformimicrobium ophioploci]|uniref:Uncharacterized protein n=1 Tax=Biformimicrobium ophioploci TaxID=3036711 RepID=A0ABQ6M2G3_9GAMM|nr:hypothetical protein [Microbulbifer sp. NKW57]GMG88541.1 hypothetical protein MNKW57_28620 [Microbulbifer sp. NKW57]
MRPRPDGLQHLLLAIALFLVATVSADDQADDQAREQQEALDEAFLIFLGEWADEEGNWLAPSELEGEQPQLERESEKAPENKRAPQKEVEDGEYE